MIETLQFGGGIVSVKPDYQDIVFEDFGFCSDFTINLEYKEEFYDKYVLGADDTLIRTKSSVGALRGVSVTGSFICESFTRARLQSLWFRGENYIGGTELLELGSLEPVISGVKFLSVSDFGPIECLRIPKVSLRLKERLMMGYVWRNVPFEFTAFLEEGFMPILQVQQEGETIPNFCS